MDLVETFFSNLDLSFICLCLSVIRGGSESGRGGGGYHYLKAEGLGFRQFFLWLGIAENVSTPLFRGGYQSF